MRRVSCLLLSHAGALRWPLLLQRASHFAQVGRIVGIEATLARYRLDGPIGWDEHDHRVANRVIVADPGQRPGRPPRRKHHLTCTIQITDKIIDGGGGLVVLS
jgi:hypothetical protein